MSLLNFFMIENVFPRPTLTTITKKKNPKEAEGLSSAPNEIDD